MITQQIQDAIITMYEKGTRIRQISRILKVSRNTVRRALRDGGMHKSSHACLRHQEISPLVRELLGRCQGNMVRVREILLHEHSIDISYSTLTRMVRLLELRDNPAKRRVGSYHFGPGEEMQHDTSPHRIRLNQDTVTAHCASLVLFYSRRAFIQYYPSYTRFEAKVFLTEAFRFMDGVCPRCIIDNTSVVVAGGSGPDARIAPEMEAFGQHFGVTFRPHRIGHADRKARVERLFSYIEKNFLAGRTFTGWDDLNRQARLWCQEVANRRVMEALGMSPDEAYLMEKSHLNALPSYIPPVFKPYYRYVDTEGYITLDTNRYSVPERFVGLTQQLEVLCYWEKIEVYHKRVKIAEHPRIIGKKQCRITDPCHHKTPWQRAPRQSPSPEEKALCGRSEALDQYVAALKKRPGRCGARLLRRLLDLQRTYPKDAFLRAVEEALHYGLYDLARVEQMILAYVARDFFNLGDGDEGQNS